MCELIIFSFCFEGVSLGKSHLLLSVCVCVGGRDGANFKDVMQGKLFQKCTHLLYCSVLSLGGNENTRRI